MAYNADNQRVQKQSPAGTTKFIWDEQNYLAEADATNTINIVYTNEPRQYGILISSRISGTTSYYHFDALRSMRQLTNTVASVTDTVLYDAWGNQVRRTGTSGVVALWNGETGYYSDGETGLFYVRARIYAPLQGRWTSVDPIFGSLSFHRYVYVGNRPVRLVDASGMAPGFADDPTWEEKGFGPGYWFWFRSQNPTAPSCDDIWNKGCFGVASCFLGRMVMTPKALNDCYADLKSAQAAQAKKKCGSRKCYGGRPSKPRIVAFSFKDYKQWWANDGGSWTLGPDSQVTIRITGSVNPFTRYDFQYYRDEDQFWYGAHDKDYCIRTKDVDGYLNGNVFGGCKGHHPSATDDSFDCGDNKEYRWITVYCVVCEGNNPDPTEPRPPWPRDWPPGANWPVGYPGT